MSAETSEKKDDGPSNAHRKNHIKVVLQDENRDVWYSMRDTKQFRGLKQDYLKRFYQSGREQLRFMYQKVILCDNKTPADFGMGQNAIIEVKKCRLIGLPEELELGGRANDHLDKTTANMIDLPEPEEGWSHVRVTDAEHEYVIPFRMKQKTELEKLKHAYVSKFNDIHQDDLESEQLWLEYNGKFLEDDDSLQSLGAGEIVGFVRMISRKFTVCDQGHNKTVFHQRADISFGALKKVVSDRYHWPMENVELMIGSRLLLDEDCPKSIGMGNNVTINAFIVSTTVEPKDFPEMENTVRISVQEFTDLEGNKLTMLLNKNTPMGVVHKICESRWKIKSEPHLKPTWWPTNRYETPTKWNIKDLEIVHVLDRNLGNPPRQ